jgi:hypothetical protein
MKRVIAAVVLGAFAGSAFAATKVEETEPPFQADCTTTAKIQFLETITVPENVDLDTTREAINGFLDQSGMRVLSTPSISANVIDILDAGIGGLTGGPERVRRRIGYQA